MALEEGTVGLVDDVGNDALNSDLWSIGDRMTECHNDWTSAYYEADLACSVALLHSNSLLELTRSLAL